MHRGLKREQNAEPVNLQWPISLRQDGCVSLVTSSEPIHRWTTGVSSAQPSAFLQQPGKSTNTILAPYGLNWHPTSSSISPSSFPPSSSDPEPVVDISHGVFHSSLKSFIFSKSFPRADLLLELWPLVVWQSLAAVVLVSVQIKPAQLAFSAHYSYIVLTCDNTVLVLTVRARPFKTVSSRGHGYALWIRCWWRWCCKILFRT